MRRGRKVLFLAPITIVLAASVYLLVRGRGAHDVGLRSKDKPGLSSSDPQADVVRGSVRTIEPFNLPLGAIEPEMDPETAKAYVAQFKRLIAQAEKEGRTADSIVLINRMVRTVSAAVDPALYADVDRFCAEFFAKRRADVLAKAYRRRGTTHSEERNPDDLLRAFENAQAETEMTESYVSLLHSTLSEDHRARIEKILAGDENLDRRKFALSLLVKYFKDIPEYLRLPQSVLFDAGQPVELRAAAARLLAETEVEVTEEDYRSIGDLLARGRPSLVAAILETVGRAVARGNASLVESLALSSGDLAVRKAAARSLDAATDSGWTTIQRVLASEPSHEVRIAALRSLGRNLSSPRSVETVLQAARSDPDPRVRWNAVDRLDDPDIPDKAKIIQALSAIMTTEADEDVLQSARSIRARLQTLLDRRGDE